MYDINVVQHVALGNKLPLDGINGEPRLCKDREFVNPLIILFFKNYSSNKQKETEKFL
jgi:hypothetical protein